MTFEPIVPVAPFPTPTTLTLPDIEARLGKPHLVQRGPGRARYGWWQDSDRAGHRRYTELEIENGKRMILEWDQPEPSVD